MKYQVIWQPVAEDELAAIWLAAADRNAVSEAAVWFDSRLSRQPMTLGESRDASVHRIAYRGSIGIEFEIVEDEKRVVVQGVFSWNELLVPLLGGSRHRVSFHLKNAPANPPSRLGTCTVVFARRGLNCRESASRQFGRVAGHAIRNTRHVSS